MDTSVDEAVYLRSEQERRSFACHKCGALSDEFWAPGWAYGENGLTCTSCLIGGLDSSAGG